MISLDPDYLGSEPKFSLGQLYVTPGALAQISEPEIFSAIRRHLCGDWGDLEDFDKEQNELALKEGMRLLSAYHSQGGEKFWIITEWDRSSTTVLLPSEY